MLTNFPNGISSCGQPIYGGMQDPTVGNIYYVIQNDQSFYGTFERDRRTKYSDGSTNIHNTIQSALDACVADRNDYVVITPDSTTYSDSAGLTMTKACVHLICPSGICAGGMATNAARVISTYAGDWLTISADKIEIAGLFVRPTVDQDGIILSGDRAGIYIHDNSIGGTVTASGTGNTRMIGDSATLTFSNYINNWIMPGYNPPTGATTCAAGIQISGSGGGKNVVRGNMIITGGNPGTITVTAGVSMAGHSNMLIDNMFAEVITYGIFTNAWNVDTRTIIMGNKVAMSSPATAGGTADKTNVQNFSSTIAAIGEVNATVEAD